MWVLMMAYELEKRMELSEAEKKEVSWGLWMVKPWAVETESW